jgi:hypothetical protein
LVAFIVLMVAFPLKTLYPVYDLHEYEGLGADFERACERLGSDAAVVVLDATGRLGNGTTQSFRSYCGFPAASIRDESDLPQLAAAWAKVGRTLWVVTWLHSDSDDLVLVDEEYQRLERTLARPPAGVSPLSFGLAMRRID